MNEGLFGVPTGASAASRPKRTVTYTSGTGTFTPLEADSWCRVTLVGGGGGGGKGISGSNGGAGGAGGQTVVTWLRVASATAYAVGAAGVGGTNGTAGGETSLGVVKAVGGGGGSGVYSTSNTAQVQSTNGDYNVSTSYLPTAMAGATAGGFGAPPASGASTSGGRPGVASTAYSGSASSFTYGGGGGSSLYGTGGAGGLGVGAAGTGYGAGGAGGGFSAATYQNAGNGTGGIIIIEEFGAW